MIAMEESDLQPNVASQLPRLADLLDGASDEQWDWPTATMTFLATETAVVG